jgi:putative acetyltransferase
VVALIELHLRSASENSPPGAVFALDLSGLRDSAVTIWTSWDQGQLLGMGALKQIDAGHGEVKSMRTVPTQLRRGIAAAMLDHLVGEAHARGYRRVSLETGGNDAFAPARALYERSGFMPCEPFAHYVASNFNRFYSLAL